MPAAPETRAAAERERAQGRERARVEDSLDEPPAPPERTLVDELCTFSLLGIFSFLGLLARLGLTAINTYNGQQVFPLVYAQIVGCAVMGCLAARRGQLEQVSTELYIGLATGLCGSITTFSSWMLGVFEGFARIDRPEHGGFYNFMDGLTNSIITLAASFTAFVWGSHFAPYLLSPKVLQALDFRRRSSSSNGNGSQEKSATSTSPISTRLHPSKPVSIALFVGLWLAACLICGYVPRWRGIVTFGLVFAPFGTWARYLLAIKLNGRFPRFPVGTFAANMLATAILAGCAAAQRTDIGTRTVLQCAVLQGLEDGLCGCLSTISTFVAEIAKLKRGDSYRYALISWAAGQAVMLVILGSVDFARHGGLQARCAF